MKLVSFWFSVTLSPREREREQRRAFMNKSGLVALSYSTQNNPPKKEKESCDMWLSILPLQPGQNDIPIYHAYVI